MIDFLQVQDDAADGEQVHDGSGHAAEDRIVPEDTASNQMARDLSELANTTTTEITQDDAASNPVTAAPTTQTHSRPG